METREFSFEGKMYKFTVTGDRSTNNPNKHIYIGVFEENAPPPCLSGKTYCLMSLDFRLSGFRKKQQADRVDQAMAYPVNRAFYDLLDYDGNHLRRILVRDDAAQDLLDACGERFPTGEELTNRSFCVIEPCYESSTEYLNSIWNNTREKLEYYYRLLLAVAELHNNKIFGKSIVAHRDLKWGNALRNRKNPVLIDFSTIRLEDSSMGSKRVFISRDNTAAEVVFGTPESSQFKDLPEDLREEFDISEKTDVFGLGGLLAELFSEDRVNPIGIWSTNNTGSDDGLRMSKQMEDAYLSLLTNNGTIDLSQLRPGADAMDEDWLERKTGFVWDTSADEKIRNLVRRMTAVNPVNRPCLSDVLSEVETWLGLGLTLLVVPRRGLQDHGASYHMAALTVFHQDSFDKDVSVETMQTGGNALKLMYFEDRCLKNKDVTTKFLLKDQFSRMQDKALALTGFDTELEYCLQALASEYGLEACGLPGRKVKIHLFAPSAFSLSENGRKAVEILRGKGAELFLHALGEANEDWKNCFVPMEKASATQPTAPSEKPKKGLSKKYGPIAAGDGELFIRKEKKIYYVSRRGGGRQ